MRKKRGKFGRKPKSPAQKTQKGYVNTQYGSYVPFLNIGGKRVTPPKPDSLQLRNWSRNNPIVRRCINIIKDKLIRQPYEFISKNPENDHADTIKILNDVLDKPNNTDTRRSFFSAIDEDLVSGDCGCFEVAITGNPFRPLFLFPTDGYTMLYVLNDSTYGWAQRFTDDVTFTPESYVYFKPDEIIYMKKQVFTNNPYGLSPIECAFEYIKALTKTFSYSSDIASNALPKYLMNIKGVQKEPLDAYRAYFIQECMGRPILPIVSAEDAQSVQIAPVSEEATFMQYQQFVIAIIALSFGIPPEKLAIAKSNDRSTIAEINENLLEDCIKPYGDVQEDAINRLVRIAGYGTEIAFQYIWADTLERQKLQQDIILNQYRADAITRNEMRRKLGYMPSSDEYANDYITVMKAKVNEAYGINGFGTSKENNVKGGDNNG